MVEASKTVYNSVAYEHIRKPFYYMIGKSIVNTFWQTPVYAYLIGIIPILYKNFYIND